MSPTNGQLPIRKVAGDHEGGAAARLEPERVGAGHDGDGVSPGPGGIDDDISLQVIGAGCDRPFHRALSQRLDPRGRPNLTAGGAQAPDERLVKAGHIEVECLRLENRPDQIIGAQNRNQGTSLERAQPPSWLAAGF